MSRFIFSASQHAGHKMLCKTGKDRRKQPMVNKFHGIFSLLLAASAILLSVMMMFKNSAVMGFAFTVFCITAAFVIISLFCAKCPSRENCGHVVPGFIADQLFKQVRPAPYTIVEIVAFVLCMGVVIIVPQFWLLKNMAAFTGYWLILCFAGISIKKNVCTTCENNFCPSNKKFKRFFAE
jgi:hypothetical protein